MSKKNMSCAYAQHQDVSDASPQIPAHLHTQTAADLTPFLNQVIVGECIAQMSRLPASSVDMVFADPPYNLQLRGALYRPDNRTEVSTCQDLWDKFSSFEAYDAFTRAWLLEARRILKPNGTLWVIGAYHNIFRVGALLQDIGYWILNDIVWLKRNPMPNFLGRRFTNAHEILIWAAAEKNNKDYTFNYAALKTFNDDIQMRSDWTLALCRGHERLRNMNNKKIHPTQKPEALLQRVLLASTNVGDTVLDPFFGTGTTGAVAKKLGRHFIGIEQDESYAQAAKTRIESIASLDAPILTTQIDQRMKERISFGALLEAGLITPGAHLTDSSRKIRVVVRVDGSVETVEGEKRTGSIHRIASFVQGVERANGWPFWHLVQEDGSLCLLDHLREKYRKMNSEL